jgi:hypothetical protein
VANPGDTAIQQALQGGGAGTAPVVPGYNPTGTGAASPASPGGAGGVTVQVGNYTLSLNSGINPTDQVMIGGGHDSARVAGRQLLDNGGGVQTKASTPTANTATVASQLQAFNGWSANDYQKFRDQAYAMGLTATKTAGRAEVLVAWQTVVEEAAKDNVATTDIVQKAVNGGWNSIKPSIVPADNGLNGTGNINNSPEASNQTTQTSYVSYMDPATAQGTLADAFQRLLGRNPSTEEYQAFLNSLYAYQDKENTGKFEVKSTDSTNAGQGGTGGAGGTGPSSNVQQNIISQRQVSTRGAQFLAGQTAIANPEEGAYQAATTYFNAFQKALSGPAAGMSASGPTNSAP